MKKLFFIFLVFTCQILCSDLNGIIAGVGIIASNWHAIASTPNAFLVNNHCNAIIKDPKNLLNTNEKYAKDIQEILACYNKTGKKIEFFYDKSLNINSDPCAYVWKNKIFVNDKIQQALAFSKNDDSFKYHNKVSHVILGHEIDHILNKKSLIKTTIFCDILNSLSNIVLYPTYNNILESDMHPLIKGCSITALAASKHFLDKSLGTLISRQHEKHADLHAAKYAKTEHLLAFSEFLKKLDSEKPHIFATHPAITQRKKIFDDESRKRNEINSTSYENID